MLIPHDGFHIDIPFDEYCRIPALNASALCSAEISLKRLRATLDGKLQRDSQAMAFGRALHCRLLEPDRFREEYRVSPGCEAPLASGARKGQLCGATAKRLLPSGKFACGKHGDEEFDRSDIVLSVNEAKAVESAAQAVLTHPVVKLLRQDGGFETSAFFTRDDVKCKMRLDKWIPGHPAILDVKKIRSGQGDLRTLEKDILNYHYDLKAAWYCEGARILTGTIPAFVWIFVEDAEPFDCRVVQCDAETLAIGGHKCGDLLYKYKRAMATGEWPGYSDDIEWGGVPAFEKERYRHVTGAK